MSTSTKTTLPEEMTLSEDGKKEFQRKMKRHRSKRPVAETGVIYIGHIPHGFFEDEMQGYFSQFGRVNRLKVSRSRRTGNSKGYGFVEFESPMVAKIVADTMNNYLMFNRLLKCELLDPAKVHPETFRGCSHKFYPPTAHLRSIERHNKPKTAGRQKRSLQRMTKRKMNSLSKLAELGISYKLPDSMVKQKENVAGDTMTDKVDKPAPQKVTKSPAAKSPASKFAKSPAAKSPATTPSPKRMKKGPKTPVGKRATLGTPVVVDPNSKGPKTPTGKRATLGTPVAVDSPNSKGPKTPTGKRAVLGTPVVVDSPSSKGPKTPVGKRAVLGTPAAVDSPSTKGPKTPLGKRTVLGTPGAVDSPSTRTRSKRKVLSSSRESTPSKLMKKAK